MVGSFSFGERAQFRGYSESQNDEEHKNAEQVRDRIQNVFGARKCNRLFVTLAGERILLGLWRLRRLSFGVRRTWNSRLRRRWPLGVRLHFGRLRSAGCGRCAN